MTNTLIQVSLDRTNNCLQTSVVKSSPLSPDNKNSHPSSLTNDTMTTSNGIATEGLMIGAVYFLVWEYIRHVRRLDHWETAYWAERRGRARVEAEMKKLTEVQLNTSDGFFVQPIAHIHSCFRQVISVQSVAFNHHRVNIITLSSSQVCQHSSLGSADAFVPPIQSNTPPPLTIHSYSRLSTVCGHPSSRPTRAFLPMHPQTHHQHERGEFGRLGGIQPCVAHLQVPPQHQHIERGKSVRGGG